MATYIRDSLEVKTDSTGAATAYLNKQSGRIVWVRYAKTDYEDGVDFDVTTEESGQTIWDQDNVNASDLVYPVRAVDDVNGTAITGTYTRVELSDERVKIVVANGGDSKKGTFEVLFES